MYNYYYKYRNVCVCVCAYKNGAIYVRKYFMYATDVLYAKHIVYYYHLARTELNSIRLESTWFDSIWLDLTRLDLLHIGLYRHRCAYYICIYDNNTHIVTVCACDRVIWRILCWFVFWASFSFHSSCIIMFIFIFYSTKYGFCSQLAHTSQQHHTYTYTIGACKLTI